MYSSKWLVKEADFSRITQLMLETGFSRAIATMLVARGLDSKGTIGAFLRPPLPDWDTQYNSLNMGKAVSRIRDAVENGEKILVYGDRDVDGVTATVIMVQTIKDLGGDVQWYVSGSEGYGLNKEILASFIGKVSLIITVDCGITALDEALFCKKEGIELIITDHHEPGEDLPDAYAIINPKLNRQTYPIQDLPGCGVSFILGQALMLTYGKYVNIEVIALAQQADGVWKAQKIVNDVRYGDEDIVSDINVFKGKLVVVADQDCASLVKQCMGYEANTDLVQICNIAVAGSAEQLAKKWIFTQVYEASRMKYYCDQMLAYVALGCVADMVPLTGMNRYIVQRGLAVLPCSLKPGIQLLNNYFELKQGESMQSEMLSWKYIPLLNAAGRCGKAHLSVELLLTDSMPRAKQLMEELITLNDARKNLQKANTVLFEELVRDQFDPEEDKMVFLFAKNIPHGVSGIIANRFLRKYHRPVALLIAQNNEIIGTIRSMGRFAALSALEQCSDLLLKYGGHTMAAGFTLLEENMLSFRKKMLAIADAGIDKKDLIPTIHIDAEIENEWIDQTVIRELEQLDPFGSGWEKPVFCLKDQRFKYVQMLGTNGIHAKMRIGAGDNMFEMVAWNIPEHIPKLKNNHSWNVAVTIEINSFKGKKSARFNLIDMKPSFVESLKEI